MTQKEPGLNLPSPLPFHNYSATSPQPPFPLICNTRERQEGAVHYNLQGSRFFNNNPPPTHNFLHHLLSNATFVFSMYAFNSRAHTNPPPMQTQLIRPLKKALPSYPPALFPTVDTAIRDHLSTAQSNSPFPMPALLHPTCMPASSSLRRRVVDVKTRI